MPWPWRFPPVPRRLRLSGNANRGAGRGAPRGAIFLSLGSTYFKTRSWGCHWEIGVRKAKVVLERLFFLKNKAGVLFSSCARKFPAGAALKAGSWLLHLPGSRIRAAACFFRPRRESYSPEKNFPGLLACPKEKKFGSVPTCKQLEELKSETTNHYESEVHERV